MKTLSPKAILLGCLVDWLGTLLFDLAFAISTGMLGALRGLSPKETELALTDWYQSVPGMAFSFMCGLGFTLLGGFVAAWISRADHLLNSACVGAIGILLTLGLMLVSDIPREIFILSMLLSIPVAVLGGFWYTKRWRLFQSDQP